MRYSYVSYLHIFSVPIWIHREQESSLNLLVRYLQPALYTTPAASVRKPRLDMAFSPI
jgi:hypothetical protein